MNEEDVAAAVEIAEQTAHEWNRRRKIKTTPLEQAQRAVDAVRTEHNVYEPIHTRALLAFENAAKRLALEESLKG